MKLAMMSLCGAEAHFQSEAYKLASKASERPKESVSTAKHIDDCLRTLWGQLRRGGPQNGDPLDSLFYEWLRSVSCLLASLAPSTLGLDLLYCVCSGELACLNCLSTCMANVTLSNILFSHLYTALPPRNLGVGCT